MPQNKYMVHILAMMMANFLFFTTIFRFERLLGIPLSLWHGAELPSIVWDLSSPTR